MTVWKDIVCLANSRKNLGRCIAGVEIHNGQVGGWIRPVSDREGHGVSFMERRLDSGSEPATLDVIRIPLLRAEPWIHQQENWLLDPSGEWSRVGEWLPRHIDLLEDHPADLWGTGESSGKGRNDRVAELAAPRFAGSLALVRVRDLRLRVYDGGFGQVKREVRAIFGYRDELYNLRVTDPIYEGLYLRQRDGVYSLGESFLTVSLAEPFEGYCYKVVAAVLELDGSTGRTP